MGGARVRPDTAASFRVGGACGGHSLRGGAVTKAQSVAYSALKSEARCDFFQVFAVFLGGRFFAVFPAPLPRAGRGQAGL
ncbi:hypothetical protein Mmc1_1172 [Magnetococcus marinus MC-1]|uniref:Uncharacterized protein n=1 Tax=Magnetococcus marinus (strain ATCC BAA-1437 / JCM 17883 / MC-1) TaxID=156889 RepID=A0L6U0_MAGMM|nr:hypothetical protein Mmc1_1172 [Magnetococcus marinus MC-1]